MSNLDFLKSPKPNDIVDKNYRTYQEQKSLDFITNYKGNSLFRDWHETIRWDMTEDTRSVFWKHYDNVSGLTPEESTKQEITATLDKLKYTQTPYERLYILQEVNAESRDEVVDHFMPMLTELQEYFSTDYAHKGSISYNQSLSQALTGLFNTEEILDALVPESIHAKDIQTIERYDKLSLAKIVNGRVTVPDKDGKPIIGSNLRYEEVVNSPDADEQFATQVSSYPIIQRHVKPFLDISRKITQDSKRQADTALFNSIDKLEEHDVAPVIVNMLDYRDNDTGKTVQKGIRTLLDNSPQQDKKRVAARVTGNILGAIYKRSAL
tara:strand:+ start:1148 stop:2116 length:969 start_codon:yes stop_codon:yes gene_type:complete